MSGRPQPALSGWLPGGTSSAAVGRQVLPLATGRRVPGLTPPGQVPCGSRSAARPCRLTDPAAAGKHKSCKGRRPDPSYPAGKPREIWYDISPVNLPSMHRLIRLARHVAMMWPWERAECEAMRARGQSLPLPYCLRCRRYRCGPWCGLRGEEPGRIVLASQVPRMHFSYTFHLPPGCLPVQQPVTARDLSGGYGHDPAAARRPAGHRIMSAPPDPPTRLAVPALACAEGRALSDRRVTWTLPVSGPSPVSRMMRVTVSPGSCPRG